MDNYNSLSAEVEAEYEEFCANPNKDLNKLYEKLFRYLKYMTRKFMNENSYTDEAEIEDIANEVLAYIAVEVLYTFKKEKAMFATYCAQIVKNKVWNWKKKRIRIILDEDIDFENSDFIDNDFKGNQDASQYSLCYSSPEYRLLALESRLEIIELVKKYIKLIMDWKQKPYRTVGCGFTMIIFQKYHPDTTELTSPKWAFGTLECNTVQQGADRFLSELREWMPNEPIMWSDEFLDAMDEQEEGIFVSDIVFGEWFKVKDFENWSLRLQAKLKRKLLESEEELCF